MKRTTLICLCLMLAIGMQARIVEGTVTDGNGESVISATVVAKGTNVGTVTDFDGHYRLDVPEDAKTLVFSYIGMETKEVTIKGNVINVILKENSEVLDEVVVTGYGTTKKRDLVTSVASVSAEQLKDIPVTSAAEAIQGKMAGVQVTTTEGSADADIKIRVRGGTSLTQSNDPLYIVDGFPVSSIADIAPSDIESMDVLKDAAATAIYGAQGANGVIIITTKSNDTESDEMTFHVDYAGYVGWKRMAKKYEMMDNRDFTLMQYEYAYLTKGADALHTNFSTYFDPNAERNNDNSVKSNATLTPIQTLLDYWAEQPTTDWQRATFGLTWAEKFSQDEIGISGIGDHQGFNSNHSFSVNGGNKNAQFTLSYARTDDKGIMYGSNYARNNLSMKAKFKPFKNFTINFSARYTNTEVLGSGMNTNEDAGSKTESRVRNAIAYTPLALLSKDNTLLEDYDSFGSMYDPITTIDHNYQKKKDNKWSINGDVSYKFCKKFTIKAKVGYEGRYRDNSRYYGPTTYYSRAGDGFTMVGETGTGHTIVTDQRNTKLQNTNTFEYKDKWGSHNFDLLIGEEQLWNKGELQTMYGYGYDANSYTGENVFNYMGAAKEQRTTNKVNDTDNMLSFFASARYDYAGRYYLTATFRADCSTRFTRGNQWGYFPSVAAAWRISEEPWMEKATWLSNLKLRFSYGTAGNNNVETGNLYTTYSIYPTNNYYSPLTLSSQMLYVGGSDKIAPNEKLKWETTVTRDLGLDFGFFKERLSGTLDLYWNTTNDLIVKYKTAVGGYAYQYRNIGSTRNRGIEFSLKGVILDKKSKRLSYGLTADANISFNENIITSLGGMETYPVATGCFNSGYKNSDEEFHVVEGGSMGQIWGYKSGGWWTPEDFASYNQTTDAWLNADGDQVKTPLGPARPGMLKLIDPEGNTITGENGERQVIGCTLPLFTGGFNITAYVGGNKWGKVDLSANFTYSYGNDVLNLSKLDYSTIFDKSKLRNLTADAAYGNRYSLFTEDGVYIPANVTANDVISVHGHDQQLVTGEYYNTLTAMLGEANAGANFYNPVSENIALTDQCVEDGSYLRLNNLTIGYSFPEDWMKKTKVIETIRIFLQGTNLFCATKYSGSDPEVDTRSKKNPLALGVDFSAYPKSRGVNIGLNIKF